MNSKKLCFAAVLMSALCFIILPTQISGQESHAEFRIEFTKEVSKKPLDGRLLLMISNDDSQEPRFQIGDRANSQLIFGIDVNELDIL